MTFFTTIDLRYIKQKLLEISTKWKIDKMNESHRSIYTVKSIKILCICYTLTCFIFSLSFIFYHLIARFCILWSRFLSWAFCLRACWSCVNSGVSLCSSLGSIFAHFIFTLHRPSSAFQWARTFYSC